MWKRSGRSSALERAQAVLSSRRGRAAPAAAAHLAPRMSQGGAVHAPPAGMPSEPLSDLGDSESSLSPSPGPYTGATVPNQTSHWAPEVPQPLTPLDSGAFRFLKRPSAAAQDQPKERAVPSSLLTSQTAALSRLAQIENRFGKSLHTKGSFRAEQTAVQEFTEETRALPSTDQPSRDKPRTDKPRTDKPSRDQPSRDKPSRDKPSTDKPSRDTPSRDTPSRDTPSTDKPSRDQPSTDKPSTDKPSTDKPSTDKPSTDKPSTDKPSREKPRCFVKSRPLGAHGRHSEESNSRWQLHTEAPPVLQPPPTSPQNTWPVQPQSNPSPCSMSPSPPCLSSVGSACGHVRFVEELLPLEAATEDAHSDCSDSSGCFRLNLMDLDELAPAALLLEEHPNAQEPEQQEGHEEEVETVHEEEVETVHEEEVYEVHEEDYHSDFESAIQTEGISEHSQDSIQPPLPRSQSNYSNMFTRAIPSDPCTPEPPPHSHAPLPQPDPTSVGLSSHLPAVCNPCPTLEVLMQSLRQQLDLTSRFISNAQEQRTRLLEGLGPPNYRYTTLQDTLQYISRPGASGSHSDQQTVRR